MQVVASSVLRIPVGVAFLSCLLAGCGGDGFSRVPLSGTVSLDGDTSRSGAITATPAQAGTSAPNATAIIENGKFSFPKDQGPVAGSYIFEVNLTVPDEEPLSAEYSNEAGGNFVTYEKTLDIPTGGSDSFSIEVTSADQRGEGPRLPPSGEI